MASRFGKMSLLTVLLTLGIGSLSFAGEVKISAGVAGAKTSVEPIADKIEKEKGIKLVLVDDPNKTGTPVITKSVLSGKAQVGLIPVPWEAAKKTMLDEKVATPEQIASFTYRVIGRDVVKVFVNKVVAIDKKLTFEEMTKVFDGTYKNWKELGGKDIKIKVVLQKQYESTNGFFKSKVMNGKDFSSESLRVESVNDMTKEVEKTEGAVAFVSSLTAVGSSVMLNTVEVIGRPVFAFNVGKPSPDLQTYYEYAAKNSAN